MGAPHTFAVLLSVGNTPAMASVPEVDEVAQPAAAPELAPRWTSRIEGEDLVIGIRLVNVGTTAQDVVVARGRSPGAWLQAEVDGVQLERVLTRAEEMDMGSRMGPMPRFAALAPGEGVSVGEFRFRLGPTLPASVSLSGSARTGSGGLAFDTVLRLRPES